MATPPVNPSPGGAGGDIVLTLSVDATTGNVVLKNFGTTLSGVQQQYNQAANSGNNLNQSNQNQALGWLALAAKTGLVVEAFKKYLDITKEIFVESTQLAARIEVLNNVLNLTARNMNYSVSQSQAQVASIRSLNITHKEAIDLTTQFIRSQLQLADATKLTTAARDLAVISGQNTSQSLETLTEAIQTNREMLLRQFGIVQTLPMIFERYAASINRSASSLTSLERQQAILNTVLFEANKVSGAYIVAMDDAGKRVTSLARLWEDAKEQIGSGLTPVFLGLVIATEKLLVVLKAIPTEAYAFLGILVGLGTAAGATIAAVKGLSAAFALLGFAGDSLVIQLRAVSLALVTSPIGMAITALALLTTAYIAWQAHTEGETKALLAQTQQLEGNVEKVQNVVKELDDLAKAQDRLNQVRAGAPLTANELGNYRSLTQASQQRLAVERMVSNVEQFQARAISDARAANVNLNGVLDQQGQKVQDIATARQRALSTEQTARVTEQAKLPELSKQLELMKQQEAQAEANQQKAQKNAEQGRSRILGLTFSNLPDPLKKWGDSAEQAGKQVDELKAKVKSLQQQIEDLGRVSKAGPIVPIDLNVEAAAAKKLQELIGIQEQASRSGLNLSKSFSDQAKAVAQGLTSGYVEQIGNLKSIQEQANNGLMKLSDEQRSVLAKDLEYYQTGLKGITTLTDKEKLSRSDVLTLLTRVGDAITRADELSRIYNNNVTNGQSATIEFAQLRLQQQEKINTNSMVELHLQEAKLQAELAYLNAISKTAVQVQRVHDLENQLADLQARMASTTDRWAASAAKVSDESRKTVNAINQSRQAQESSLNIQQQQLTITQNVRSLFGTTLAEEISGVRARYGLEIAQIQNSTKLQAEQVAEIQAKRTQMETEITRLQIGEVQKRAEFESSVLAAIYVPIQQRVKSGTANSGDVEALQNYEHLKEQADLRAFQNEEMLRIQATQGDIAAAEALAAKRIELAQRTANSIQQIEISAMEARYARENELQNLRLRSQVAGGSIQESDAQFLRDRVQLQQELNKLVAQHLLTQQEAAKLEETLTTQMQNQANVQRLQQLTGAGTPKDQAALKGAQLATQYGASAQTVSGGLDNLSDKLTPIQQRITELNQKLAEGKISFQQYAGAIQDMSPHLVTLDEVFQRFMNGTLTKLTILDAGLNLAGQAATTFFEKLGQGHGGAKALEGFGDDILKQLAKLAMQQSIFQFMAGLAYAADPLTAALAPPAFLSASLWLAAAAGLGVAAGAAGGASGGGGGGGGGYGNSGSSGARAQALSQQQIAPTGSTTNVASAGYSNNNMVTFTNDLVVAGRTIAAAGSQFSNIGSQIYQFINAEQEMSNSNQNTIREFADAQANTFEHYLNQGVVGTTTQFGQFLTNFSQQAGQIAETNNTAALGIFDTALGPRLDSIAKGQDEQTGNQLNVLGQIRDQLVQLNNKNSSVNLSAEIMLDGGNIGDIMSGAVAKAGTRIGAQVIDSIRNNTGRQAMGNALGTGGI